METLQLTLYLMENYKIISPQKSGKCTSICWGSLANKKPQKRNTTIKIKKESVVPSLFTGSMIDYIDNPKLYFRHTHMHTCIHIPKYTHWLEQKVGSIYKNTFYFYRLAVIN